MRRHLAIEFLEVEGWGTFWRVKEQTHRGKDFSKNLEKNYFISEGGFEIRSNSYPYVAPFMNNSVDVCGFDKNLDDRICLAPSSEWVERFKTAIREYNELEGSEDPPLSLNVETVG